ncbi:hypothetical protein PENTCL1PPCAC_12735, partial [Pristionchus entomophagus]
EEHRCPYKCDECGRRFTLKGGLTSHKKTHLSDDDPLKKRFPCAICGRIFFQKGHLNMHKKLHSDDEKE